MDIDTSRKSPEVEAARIQAQAAKPVSFTNGVLKRHLSGGGGAAVVVSYKECLKNHAASLGGHALDGCGEFMASPSATSADPTSLKCAACGCHRNFHRRDPEDPPPTHVIEYQPHHRHHPPPPIPHGGGSPSSASPPPISSSYYPSSAPHMLLALSHPPNNHNSSNSSRKRFRTKFTSSQKEKMQEFAERVGWKVQRSDDHLVHAFCDEVGVDRGVLKVWMHNNKNNLNKINITTTATNGNGNGDQNNNNNNNGATAVPAPATNGSSSSS